MFTDQPHNQYTSALIRDAFMIVPVDPSAGALDSYASPRSCLYLFPMGQLKCHFNSLASNAMQMQMQF